MRRVPVSLYGSSLPLPDELFAYFCAPRLWSTVELYLPLIFYRPDLTSPHEEICVHAAFGVSGTSKENLLFQKQTRRKWSESAFSIPFDPWKCIAATMENAT